MKQSRLLALAMAGALSALASGCGPDSAGAPEALATTGQPLACSTRITYGDRWIKPSTHPEQYDIAAGAVTWDGRCINEGTNSYALLSNGWKPYFSGNNACVIALDPNLDCGPATACTTRITYSASWIKPSTHTTQYDDAAGRVYWDRGCTNEGTNSYTTLSNGWTPYFTGNNACGMSFRYTGCGGLYINPVVPVDCADPGVIHDGTRYVAACTSGGAAQAFPLRTSTNLVDWTFAGHIFPSGRPAWATGDFWAPEIHRVGTRFIAYYTARHTSGKLAIGAATSASATGPFTDLGRPLVLDLGMGMIDATFFRDTAGVPYLVWKADGNAVGQATPIYGQQLTADGLALTGTRRTLISNTLSWEGAVVEAPWVVYRGGYYYLFYSGNAYYDSRYAVGVARATSPLGPYTKLSVPILKTGGGWTGPGHNSVVTGPGGDTYMVYHAWNSAHTARVMLVDGISWPSSGWPAVPEGASSGSRPMP